MYYRPALSGLNICGDAASCVLAFLPLSDAHTVRDFQRWCCTRARTAILSSLRELVATNAPDVWTKVTWAVDAYKVTPDEAARYNLVRYDRRGDYTTLSLIERLDPGWDAAASQEWWRRSYPD